MNTSPYVCRCACGQVFSSAYTTTTFCPGCAIGILVDFAPEPDRFMEPDAHEFQEDGNLFDDNLFAAAGYLCCHPFSGISFGEHLAHKSGRVNWALVLLIAAFVSFAVGYGCAVDQANAGGWGQ